MLDVTCLLAGVVVGLVLLAVCSVVAYVHDAVISSPW